MARAGKLSVAISTRDRPDALERCLAALAAGDVVPAEVVVVDQSSADETGAVVERAQATGLAITYVQQQPLGLAVSQNTAVGRATRPVVAVLDDDCIPDRRWLATVERSMAAPEGLAAVTGRVLPLEPAGDRVYPVASRYSTVERVFQGKALPWPVGGGNNFAVRREWFERIGGCDERLGPGSPGEGGMDLDLFYRLLRGGGRIRYVPEALVHHERQTRAGRMVRRPMYGHGMGACCVFRLREGDAYALGMLTRWILYRARLLGGALVGRRWMSAQEEWLLLRGTARGVLHGLRTPGPMPRHDPSSR